LRTEKPVDFDQYAETYDETLNRGLQVTGESKDYFARERILWIARCLKQMAVKPRRVLDYGCGTGGSTSLLKSLLKADSVIGIDSSVRSLDQAKRVAEPGCHFFLNSDYHGEHQIDLVYCNGVFHHIPPAQRPAELAYILKCLRPGGLFALWENNPWNPGTQYVMWRIPFDRDAIKLSPISARNLVRNSGFNLIKTDFLFFFPRFLKALRRLEPFMSSVPIGGQYQVLAQRPQFVSSNGFAMPVLPG
jgi:SAM-dependent methyltransferase